MADERESNVDKPLPLDGCECDSTSRHARVMTRAVIRRVARNPEVICQLLGKMGGADTKLFGK